MLRDTLMWTVEATGTEQMLDQREETVTAAQLWGSSGQGGWCFDSVHYDIISIVLVSLMYLIWLYVSDLVVISLLMEHREQ